MIKNLLWGFAVNWFLAASPINRSPSGVNATYDGVNWLPCSLSMILTSPFLNTPARTFVVPRAIAMIVPYPMFF